jgi:hypothetical protein
MKFSFLCAAIIVLGLFASIRAWASDVGDICGANARSAKSIGMHVSFRGKILSDGMHLILVVPDRCQGEGYAISANGTEDDPASVVRHAVMQIGSPGTTDKEVTIDVDAVVVMLPNGSVGVRVTRLNHMVLTYPATQ